MSQREQNFQIRLRINRPGLSSIERMISTIPCRIGRGPENDIDLGDGSVSSNHAILEWDSVTMRFTLRDMGSRNGIRRAANGEVLKGASLRLEPGKESFVLGAVSIEIDIQEFAAQQPTATPELAGALGKHAVQATNSQSLPSVRVLAGKVSGGGPKGGGRSIKMREPTGGIRIDRSQPGQVHARLNIGNPPQALRFSRAGEGLDARAGTGNARARGTGLFWPGLLLVLVASFAGSKTLMQGELGALIPESLDAYIIGVAAAVLLAVIGFGTLVVTGIRFLFKRGDIPYGTLFAQVMGAFAVANGLSLIAHALAQLPEVSGVEGVEHGANAFRSGLYWLFGIHGLMLLRSRAVPPGIFARFSPWFASIAVFALMLAVPSISKGIFTGEMGEGMAVLRQSPPIPPFISAEESQTRNPAAIPGVEHAVMEFMVGAQELDEKLAKKSQELKAAAE